MGRTSLFSVGKLGEKILRFNEIFGSVDTKIIGYLLQKLNNKSKHKINRDYLRKMVYRSIKNLEKKGMVSVYRNNRKIVSLSLTKKGEKAINLIKLKNSKDFWDKKYKKITTGERVVFFDIPESMKRIRNVFRVFLKMIGYKEVQKSVFISRYENIDDLKVIVEVLDISRYVMTGIFFRNELS